MSAPKQGRIEEGGAGIGAPTPEEVEQRAKELAKIAGRTEMNKADWETARRELTGQTPRDEAGEGEASASWASQPDAAGHQVDTESPEEEQIDHSIGEELVSEGVDEASHDQMLEAREEEDRGNEE